MPTSRHTPWTPETTERLRKLVERGNLSVQQIADRLGVTKKATSAKMCRMEWRLTPQKDLQKRKHPLRHNAMSPKWTVEETNRLIEMRHMSLYDIYDALPDRGARAIRDKLRKLPNDAQLVERPVSVGEDKLLDALIQYGLKYRTDLGMGSQTFYARAAERGILV